MKSVDIRGVLDILPHRYPFLLVDKILDLEPGKRAVGLKNVTIGEPFFTGHFPGMPVMPGVLMIEAAAQVGACALLSDERFRGSLAYLGGVDGFRFRRSVIPGDTLIITVELVRILGKMGKAKARIACEEEEVCSGEILFAIDTGEEGC